MLALILLVFALVLFVTSAFVNVEPWRWRTLCIGLACWVAAEIFGRAGMLTLPH